MPIITGTIMTTLNQTLSPANKRGKNLDYKQHLTVYKLQKGFNNKINEMKLGKKLEFFLTNIIGTYRYPIRFLFFQSVVELIPVLKH